MSASRGCAVHPGGCSPRRSPGPGTEALPRRARGAEQPPPGSVSLRDTRRVPPAVAARRPGPGFPPCGAPAAAPAPHAQAQRGLRIEGPGRGRGRSRGYGKGPFEGETSLSSPGSPPAEWVLHPPALLQPKGPVPSA